MSKKKAYTFQIYGSIPLSAVVTVLANSVEEAEESIDAEGALLHSDRAEWPEIHEIELIEVEDAIDADN